MSTRAHKPTQDICLTCPAERALAADITHRTTRSDKQSGRSYRVYFHSELRRLTNVLSKYKILK